MAEALRPQPEPEQPGEQPASLGGGSLEGQQGFNIQNVQRGMPPQISEFSNPFQAYWTGRREPMRNPHEGEHVPFDDAGTMRRQDPPAIEVFDRKTLNRLDFLRQTTDSPNQQRGKRNQQPRGK